jgi:hypothetical protein
MISNIATGVVTAENKPPKRPVWHSQFHGQLAAASDGRGRSGSLSASSHRMPSCSPSPEGARKSWHVCNRLTRPCRLAFRSPSAMINKWSTPYLIPPRPSCPDLHVALARLMTGISRDQSLYSASWSYSAKSGRLLCLGGPTGRGGCNRSAGIT